MLADFIPLIVSFNGAIKLEQFGMTQFSILYAPINDRRPRGMSGTGHEASVATLCVLVEIEPCDQIQPRIVIDFGQITVLLGDRPIPDFCSD